MSSSMRGVLARLGASTCRGVYGAIRLGKCDCGFEYSCTSKGCVDEEDDTARCAGICADGALGTGASCANPAGTITTAKKMAAMKTTAARRNAVNTLKRCIRIISIGDTQLVTISDLPQPIRFEGTGRSGPQFRRHLLIRRPMGKSSLQSSPSVAQLATAEKTMFPAPWSRITRLQIN